MGCPEEFWCIYQLVQAVARGVPRLVSLRLGDMEWNDLGDPERVITTLLKSEMELPAWAHLWLNGKGRKEAEAN